MIFFARGVAVFILVGLGVLCCPILQSAALAQSTSSNALRLLMPYAPGSG